MTNIALFGCNGKMGQVIAGIVNSDPDVKIAFGYDINTEAKNSFPVYNNTESIKEDADVIIDFSHPASLPAIIKYSKEKKIPAQLEILEGGGTDTCSMQVAGCGSRATAISVPTRYIHSNNETISKKDYDACVALTVALLEKDLNEYKN